MKKYYLAALFLAVLILGASTPATAQIKGSADGGATGGDTTTSSFLLTNPHSGDVLRGGQQVQITWDLTLDKSITSDPFAEMEFFLQTNEGVRMRITPQMSVTARTFTWTVPNINTKTAKLVLQAGTEGGGDRYTFAQSGTFYIVTLRGSNSIFLNAMQEEVKPGEDVEISWTSNLDGYTSYDVMVSYDRGAHFHKARTTTETRFALPVDDDFARSITVQIVSRRADGSKVKSLLTKDATLRVGEKEDR